MELSVKQNVMTSSVLLKSSTLTLFDPTALQQVVPQREHRLPIRRFEQECEFMSAIRHPHIVQYLGMFRDTDTRLPVLLMELMDDSLTHFLESSPQPIPYHIQVNICHDITLALSFLHSNKIVHRDLSSNNVLLQGNILAKVTDFGMARLGDINPRATRFTNTTCPSTDVYMPPEAVQDKSVYTEKIDCFSFGVIIVQTLTRQFPKPGDRLQEVEFNHPGLPRGRVCVRVPEIDRRQNHISQIDPNHSLLPIVLNCLKDEGSERPSAHQLCERVADLKGISEYRDSARAVQDKDEEKQQLRQHIREKDQTISIIRQQSEEKERQLGRVNQQLEASEQVVAQFERRITELEQQLSQKEQQKTKASSREKKEVTSFKLTWREGKRAPCGMYRSFDTVVDGNTVYVMKSDTGNIYSYDVISDSWSQLPDCVHGSGSIIIINGCVTTVGGYSYLNRYHYYYNYYCCSALLGGRRGSSKVLSTVEVMDTETRQWSTAADLPRRMSYVSATVCGDRLYMLGGAEGDYYVKSVYTCSVSALLQSCVPSSLEAEFHRTSLEDKARVWRQVADLPVTQSACESFHGRLLAVGGMKFESGKDTTAVYIYNFTTNSWEIISHIKTGRHLCFTAVLPNNQLMIVGGVIRYNYTDSIELATVCDD